MLHGACFFFILYFPTGEGLPSDSVCVYRYLFLSSYRFRVEAVEAALPNTSLVINKYYFVAALPKKLIRYLCIDYFMKIRAYMRAHEL